MGSLAQVKTLTYHNKSSGRPPRVRGPETRTYKKRLGEESLFSFKNTGQRGDPIAVYRDLMGGNSEGGARLFLKVHRDRARENRHKLEHGKFHY